MLLLIVIYAAFISLGLPDSLLGAAWPAMQKDLMVPVSGAGTIFMIIAFGTICSSLCSDRLTRLLGTGKVTVISVAVTALALWGFSVSSSYGMLCVVALPYGLGAGAVDAGLNNYVALHYKARHMNWLHCFWGIGAAAGPYIMSICLMKGVGWQGGYRSISCIQVCLTLGLALTLGLWKTGGTRAEMDETGEKAVSAASILKRQGIVPTLCSFFCYCAVEQTAGLWAATYMVMVRGIPAERAALWASMFYVGITAGRLISGFISFRLTDTAMVWLGQCVMAVGIFCLLLPLGETMLCVGLVMTGLGCAPVYPGLLHDTPVFGEDISQVLMGLQMACAYVGTMLMPSLFGVLSNVFGLGFYPVYLLAVLVVMSAAFEMRVRILHRGT